jgi:hypothetical protein
MLLVKVSEIEMSRGFRWEVFISKVQEERRESWSEDLEADSRYQNL